MKPRSMIRRLTAGAGALIALALCLGGTAGAVPPGTPTTFSSLVKQANGIAASSSHIFVSTPWCQSTAFKAGAPNTPAWNIDSLSATGVPSLFASIAEPYDASALVGDITFTAGVNVNGAPATNCAEVSLRISPLTSFGVGALYAAFGGHIYKVSSTGVVSVFTNIPALDVTNPHTSIGFDVSGGQFGGDMLVVGTNAGSKSPLVAPFGQIYKVNSAGVATLVTSLAVVPVGCTSTNAFNGCVEGVDIVGGAPGLSLYAGQLVTQLGRSPTDLAMVTGAGVVTFLNDNLFGKGDYTGEEILTIPSTAPKLCTAKPGGIDTGFAFFNANFDQFNEPSPPSPHPPGVNPPNSQCFGTVPRPAGSTIIGFPASNFTGLGGQLIQNPEANGTGDSGYMITTGSANATDATGTQFDNSCYEGESMTFVVCAACSTKTLTWGYWKKHTGSSPPPRDSTYNSLSTTCPAVNNVGALSLDGDCDNASDSFKPTVITCGKKITCGAQSADALFAGGNIGKPNCSGNCVTLFAAQLLALELSDRKDGGNLSNAIYNNPLDPTDPFNGQSVGQILTAMQKAFDTYVDGGGIKCGGVTGSFGLCQSTLDAINNNSESSNVVLTCP